jgi:hypothetical protein
MKLTLALVLGSFLFAVAPSVSHAAQLTPIDTVRSVSFDGKNLEAVYQVSGGCAEHTGGVIIDYHSVSDTYTVNVYDETVAGDNCEAIIPVLLKLDLQSRITAMAAAGGRPAGARMKVILPKVGL